MNLVIYCILTCLVHQNGTVCFKDSVNGEVLNGYLSIKKSNANVDYHFPDDDLRFDLNYDSLEKSDSVFFNINFKKIYIPSNKLVSGVVVVDATERLEEILIVPEYLKIYGVYGRRAFPSSNSPVSGHGYIQKITQNKDCFLSSVEVKVINNHLYFGKKIKSYKNQFKIFIGKSETASNYVKPEILFEGIINITSKKNKWYKLDLEDRIDLNDIKYLFIAIKGNGDFYTIGSRKAKHHPDIISYHYVYPRDNEWKRIDKLHLPMIRYTLSNKAN